jgi:hypothetical protein
MKAVLSDSELQSLRVAWLAWRDINSPLFIRQFRTIWERDVRGIEHILRKCNWKISLQNFSKIGLTLDPKVSFAFCLIPESFLFNVWSFLFCHDDKQAYCRPLFLLSNEMVHEYSHFKFHRKQGILGKDKTTKQQYEKTQGTEGEKYALSQEALFLKRLKTIVPERVSIKLFRVSSWTNQGNPLYKTENAEIELKKQISAYIHSCKRKIERFSSKEKYDTEMVNQKTLSQDRLSSILALKTPASSTAKEFLLDSP